MDLETVADGLYGLPLDEFTAARTAQEKTAKASGDRALAAAIRSLGKPNQVGWLVNQLVRTQPEQVEAVVALGRGLRDAPTGPAADQLQEVARRERELVRELASHAKGLFGGRAVGLTLLRGLEETIHAAVVDPESAELVLRGRLTTGLQHYGFALTPTAGPSLTLVPGGGGEDASPSGDAEEPNDAEVRAAEAQEARDEAEQARDAACLELAKADDKVDRMRTKLDAATTASKRARREYEKRSAAYDKLAKAAKEAQAALRRRRR